MNVDLKSVSIQNAEHYTWGGHCDGWHLLDRDDVSVIQERVPSGTTETMHVHKLARQFFFILEGEATIDSAGKRIVVKKGNGVEIPPGVPHQLRNDSPADISFLVLSVPKSHNDRYEQS